MSSRCWAAGAFIPPPGCPAAGASPSPRTERAEIEEIARQNIEFALFSLQVFDQMVWQNPLIRELVQSDVYCHRTYSMGTVDEQQPAEFLRRPDPRRGSGGPGVRASIPAAEYARPHRRARGAVDLPEVSVPQEDRLEGLCGRRGQRRLLRHAAFAAQCFRRPGHAAGAGANSSDSTQAFGARSRRPYQPVHHRLATHWARLIEMLYAAERMLELAADPEITSPDVRRIPQRIRRGRRRVRWKRRAAR